MSRLRNRITKADFYTDPELLRWPRDKREFYRRLWAIAEDSGCLEDEAFGWKLILYPSPLDADITLEVLELWRDELTAAGKLIAYEADGKRYLYLRNFHQHEQPRNPQKPDLPLPPWVNYERTTVKRGDGEVSRNLYSISTDIVPSRHDDSAATLLSPQPSPALSSPALSSSNSAKPVDNSADQERGCSLEQEDPGPEQESEVSDDSPPASKVQSSANLEALRLLPTCGDRECAVRTVRCGLRGTVAQIVGPAEAGNLYNEATPLHRTMAGMAGYVCAAAWKASNAATMDQRQPLCRKAMVAYAGQLYDFHRQKPIRSLPAFLRTRYANMTEAPISDELLEELRNLEKVGGNGKAELRKIEGLAESVPDPHEMCAPEKVGR